MGLERPMNVVMKGDISNATALPKDVKLGKVFYNNAGQQTGTWEPKATDFTGDADALPAEVLKGKTFYNASGRQTGELEISSLGGSSPLAACTDFRLETSAGVVRLFWKDPVDIYNSKGELFAEWVGTKIVRKIGSAPQNENDGEVIYTSTVRDQHELEPYSDTSVREKAVHYYSLFPYTTENIVSKGVTQEITPYYARIMTVVLDQTSSDTIKNIVYEDDAVEMEPGGAEWDEFFHYRPCLLKDGKVVGYLKETDFTKFEDETLADITSGDSGDVMIEFPRRGLHIETVGAKVYIKMTDAPDDPEFEYYAHSKGEEQKEYFYISAYFATALNEELRSLKTSISTQNARVNFSDMPSYKEKFSEGISFLGFYQYLYFQAMLVLKYKSLDSQNSVGWGVVNKHTNGTTQVTTYSTIGSTYDVGMNYGTKGASTRSVKVFGIENPWSQGAVYLDGIVFDRDKNIYVSNDVKNFNFRGEGYESIGTLPDVSNKFTATERIIGTSKGGFLPLTCLSGTSGYNDYYFDVVDFNSFSYAGYSHYVLGVGGIYQTVDFGVQAARNYTGAFYYNFPSALKNDGESLSGAMLCYLMYL